VIIEFEAVIIEYEQTTQDNDKEFLSELLELAVGYLVLVEEESFHADIEQLSEVIHQIIIDVTVTLEQEDTIQSIEGGQRLYLTVPDRLLFLKNCGFKIKDIAISTYLVCSRRTVERHLMNTVFPCCREDA